MFRLQAVIFLFGACVFGLGLAHNATTLYEWDVLDYDWDALGQSREEAISSGAYVPENNALTGIKVFEGEIYVSVPRWLEGIPSTLNKVVMNSSGASVLQPYPSAWFNNVSNPDGIIYIQSMEIDTKGRMWILDVGRSNIYGAAPVNGSAKIVLWNIRNNDEIDRFVLPGDISYPASSFLNDIVVDEGRMIAYISDSGRGSIVIVDMENHRSAVFEDKSTKSEASVSFIIEGVNYGNTTFTTPEDGIALTPNLDWVYYCALQSLTLYRIPAEVLRTWPFDSDAAKSAVEIVGFKSSGADGMAFSSMGVLYSGGITDPDNNVWFYDPGVGTSFSQSALVTNVRWADTFAFDGNGSLVFTSNHLEQFFTGSMNFESPQEPNFAIRSVYIGCNSYLEGPNQANPSTAPTATPSRTSEAEAVDVAAIAQWGSKGREGVVLLLGN